MAIVNGTNGNDLLDGTNGNDTVKGLNGNDSLNGFDGDDILDGGGGNDTLNAGIGEDQLLGGIGLDTLVGGSGNNRLDGGAGNDSMTGGAGDDVYVVDSTADVVAELFGEGTDTVEASASYTLSADVENLTLVSTRAISGTGNALDNTITGSAAANKLFGLDGADTLNGGIGIDSLTGGIGDDVYVVDNKGDKVFENGGEGLDTVIAFADHTLGANVEVLQLAEGALNATPGIRATGNADINTIIGNSADNTLDGAGGVDTLQGGTGNDVYVVDDANEVLVELAGEGIDTVRSAITFDLGAIAEVEGLTLTGTAAIDGFGNGLDNILTGNSAVNTLAGFLGNDTINGGAGADVMIGGGGNDIYYIDNAGDLVSELAGGGQDTVFTGITVNLGLVAQEVEALTLTGRLAINATGNTSDNIITGNAGANTLDGGSGSDTLDGGLGTDTLRGGIGDDVYIINAATGKTIAELAGEGVDEVRATVTYVLGSEVDNLVLLGAAALNGTGNALANTITGTTGNNTLNGMGGVDTLIGNGGTDVFIVDDAGDVVNGVGTIFSSASRNLTVNTTSADHLTLTGTAAIDGTGNANANTIMGNTGANILDGGAGNDVLYADALDTLDGGGDSDTAVVGFTATVANAGWTSIENITLTGTGLFNAIGDGGSNTLIGNSGKNTLDGGLGDDTYGVSAGDVILDTGGIDTVRAGMTYTLQAGMENIILTGTGNFNAFGDAGVNTIIGNAGKNTLDGRGGSDTLAGGAGDDTYIVTDATLVIDENFFGGGDTVRSSVTYSLPANVDYLVLTGTADIDGYGNGGFNRITGNSGDNTLGGGAGADVLAGGAGNDTFLVDDIGDVVTDTSGIDHVIASTLYYIMGTGIENLTLNGMGALVGIGNNLRNVITGSAGNNTIDGGTGVDTLIGGLGDDIYVVDNASDVILENLNEGNDIVISSVSYTLAQDTEFLYFVESIATPLTGTGNGADNSIVGAFGNDILRGLNGNDILFGNGGSDTLYGGAGDDVLAGDISLQSDNIGRDVMTGGEGADRFYFDADTYAPLTPGGFDLIMDYSAAEGDTIDLSDVVTLYDPLFYDIEDFIDVTAGGLLRVDISGNGGAGGGWVTVARVTGANDITDIDFILPP